MGNLISYCRERKDPVHCWKCKRTFKPKVVKNHLCATCYIQMYILEDSPTNTRKNPT